MRLRRSGPDISAMSTTAALQDRPASLSSVRAHRGDDAAELQRRLEAFLLIARRVSPEVRRTAA